MWADVSRETFDRLEIFAKLVEKWNPAINLIARSTLPDLRSRHIEDSLQLLRLTDGPVDHWVDLGSGGGFPGIVIAICAEDFHHIKKITLIESDKRKATFLRAALRETGSSATVIAERIEQAEPQNASVVSARALADLKTLAPLALRHLKPDGMCLFPKGAGWQEEMAEMQMEWSFSHEACKSATHDQAVILKIKGISRV